LFFSDVSELELEIIIDFEHFINRLLRRAEIIFFYKDFRGFWLGWR
jgi:hypothetical protein